MIIVRHEVVTWEQPVAQHCLGNTGRGWGGGGRRPLRVLELDYNHSFSASLAELRSLHICIALVLVFRGANSSESQDVSVVFALSPLLFLPPRPT